MSEILPDCMIGPSEPCDGFKVLQARIAELEAEAGTPTKRARHATRGRIFEFECEIARLKAKNAELEAEVARLKELLFECSSELTRSLVFITARQKIHPVGAALINELCDRIEQENKQV